VPRLPRRAEHSLCWKLKQSPQLGSLYCLPGNAGIAAVAECVGGIGVSDVPKVRAALLTGGVALRGG
jgi:phosphoribosylamine-glycine ligase